MIKGNFSLRDVYLARNRISTIAIKTPILEDKELSSSSSFVYLKLENLQITGSFKLRGAANKILSLSDEERARGVITVSSGNHGRAVSYVAKKVGVRATVCVPRVVPISKQESILALGAELVVEGENADEAMVYADKLQIERGMTMVHPFDDLDVIAGQGTIGVELLEEFPEIDTVIVPLSGGGLISGIAFSLKQASPTIRVIGVSMDRGPAMVESLKAGRVVDIIEEPSLADALMGGLNKDNQHTFTMVQKYVDETVLVSEDEIAAGMIHCLHHHHMIVEGGAAVAISALLSNKIRKLGKNIAVVISGSNVSISVLKKLIASQ